jgi:hypothetical protein
VTTPEAAKIDIVAEAFNLFGNRPQINPFWPRPVACQAFCSHSWPLARGESNSRWSLSFKQ